MLPKTINVSKTVTYDVEQIVEEIHRVNGLRAAQDATIEDVVEWISDWVQEDFDGAIDLVYQDEDGNII